MDDAHSSLTNDAQNVALAVPTQPAARPLLIAVPFYKNEQLVPPLCAALAACAADLAAINAQVVFYNDSPGHAPLTAALDKAVAEAASLYPCRLHTNPQNLGFVRTMNQAVAEAVTRQADLLLLNSDATPTPGAFPEMLRVAATDHMIGFVNPRSNNATLATLPLHTPPATPAQARAAFQALAARLPPLTYAPTAVGFCMLISGSVLAEFGGFDEIYGAGYNEENDLVMRAARCGFRAALANHAFVWHEGEQSFATAATTRNELEAKNRAILDARYPEYGRHTANHYHAPETQAERLLAALQPDAQGRLDIAFDFSSFRADHNGTFQAGRQLLAAAIPQWSATANIHVIATQEVYDFHAYADLGAPRSDPHAGRIFAAIFRVGQPYDWNALQRLFAASPVVGVYMLDTISVDCPQLTTPLLYNMWQFTLDHIDLLATQSQQTRHQFAARFTLPAKLARVVSHHSLDLADYHFPPSDQASIPTSARPRLLVLGNHFHHKYLAPTTTALAAAFPDRDIVALGAPKPSTRPHDPATIPPLPPAPNLIQIPLGELPESALGAEYAAASVVIFPSHAEGFGLPALHALAAGRPIYLRRLPVFEELWAAQAHTPNMHFYESTTDLIAQLQTLPAWHPHTPPAAANGAARSAAEIKSALDQAIANASFHRIVSRLRALALISDLSHTGARPAEIDTKAARAARYFSERIESLTLRLLQSRIIYAITRFAFRAQRRVRLLLKGK